MDRPARLAGLYRLAVGTTVASLALVALGGAVRATDSGLACPTWPGCFSAGDWLPPADLNVWLEHSHRLLAGAVGLAVAALVVWTLARHRDRPDLWGPAVLAGVLVNVQAGLGALVVWRQLRAELVTMHLGLAMIVVACLIVLAVNVALPRPLGAARAARDLAFARAAAAVAVLAFAQILVGGHVTGIGAGLAYPLEGFPLMDGAVVPVMSTPQQVAHVVHRLLGVAVIVAVVGLGVMAARQRRALAAAGVATARHRRLLRLPLWALGLVLAQGALGVANLATGLSALTVIPHLAVASWIWALLVLTTVSAHRLAAPVHARAPLSPATPASAGAPDDPTAERGGRPVRHGMAQG